MFERILAAIDSDLERSAKVIDAAKTLALAFGSQVVIAHVRDVERPGAMIASTPRPGAMPPAVYIESEEEARQLVESAVEQLRHAGVRAEGEVGRGAGSTARELLEIAEARRSTLIVVGDRNSRVTDILLGGVAHRVVHLADCPVLLIR